jgi:hypothetical protein
VDVLDDSAVEVLQERARSQKPTDHQFASPSFNQPLSADDLYSAERLLHFALPPSLRQVYGSIANGGFGPGCGFTGLIGGHLDDLKRDVVGDYLIRRQPYEAEPEWSWPEMMLPVCHWGCAIYSCIDCSTAEALVVRFNPNRVDKDWSVAWKSEAFTLSAWLSAWLNDVDLFGRGTPPPVLG